LVGEEGGQREEDKEEEAERSKGHKKEKERTFEEALG
jgi:hypothetical protein